MRANWVAGATRRRFRGTRAANPRQKEARGSTAQRGQRRRRRACMQLKRTKWCSLLFLTMDRNMTKKMMSGANWLPK